jgi:ribosomal protein L11 methyltransferase
MVARLPPPDTSPELYALLLDTPEALVDPVSSALFELGASGIEERESTIGSCLVVYAQEQELLGRWRSAIERHYGALEWEIERVDPSWTREWLRFLKTERVTPSFAMQPVGAGLTAAGEPIDLGPDVVRIVYEPTLTFGTGGHATTRLCARELEAACRREPGRRVLDVGCGTGVLAFVAALSGAESVLGVDVEPLAVSSATRNAELNGLTALCRFSGVELAALDESFDIVVANIEVGVLTGLLGDLRRVVAPGGQLLLSGILPEQSDALLPRLEQLGLGLVYARDEGEFRLLRLRDRQPG